ncbi:MAG TPA: alpha/beta hydrolase-fold protein [Acidimicrobiales bacterium]|nr:alpha/beta hydrolase-fold protein [Acidimicrobiales bacterium]
MLTRPGFDIMKTSLVGLPFVGGLFGVAAVAAVLAVVRRRARIGWMVLAVVSCLLGTAATVNRYFGYLPNVGSVLGQRASDQVSARSVRALRQSLVSAGPGDQAVPLPLRGKVELVSIPPTVSGFRARHAQVYLPPAWFTSPRPALPVIELLHGTPGTPEDWTRAGRADVAADAFAATRGGRAPIIVMPDVNGGFTRDSECVDRPGDRAETYLTTDVPQYAVQALGANPDRRAWTIAGSSEGGYCAVDLGLRHADRYAAVVDLSGLDRPTYPGGAHRLFATRRDQRDHQPLVLLADRTPPRQFAMWLTAGTAESGNLRAVKRVAAAARRRGVEVHLTVVPGGRHTWGLWRRAFRDLLPVVADRAGVSGVQPARSGTT